MTIALLSAASSIHTIRWANAFVERGHVVHLISQHAAGEGLNAAVVLHRLPHMAGLGYLLNRPALARLLSHIKPDVVNAHYATGYGSLARWVGKVPLVLNVWGSDVFAFPEKSAFHRWLVCRNLMRATAVVSTSKAMADRTRGLCPQLGAIAVVPFGVDTNVFNPFRKSGANNTITIGTVKTLEPVYGVDRLVEAFISLCHAPGLPHIQLRVTGNGSERDRLEQLVNTAGLKDRVTFTAAVAHDQVPAALAELDIYVALSRAESFGVAVIEASACGLPVVVSDAGGLPEVVVDGVTGMVIPGGDVKLAVEELHRLVLDAGLRRDQGKAGRELVIKKYKWGHCVDQQLAVLERAQRP